ncbi:Uncharacterized protein TCM_000156 [Theobroma cacao]|uniref:Uncharacterized protein n=1 Tax=Theobroma cacao TaxID=3641 RepID=A0A061DLE3_THECC|nr:Uncharacterized protein TCM_000156 [Theobroma cacao]
MCHLNLCSGLPCSAHVVSGKVWLLEKEFFDCRRAVGTSMLWQSSGRMLIVYGLKAGAYWGGEVLKPDDTKVS